MTFQNRVEKVKQQLSKNNLSGMFVTNLTNIRYLTGFTGSAAALLLLDKEQYFFTDGRYTEQSKEQIKNCKIHIISKNYYQYIADNNFIKNNIRIGFEGDHMSVTLYDNLIKLMSKVQWTKITGLIEEIAAVKDKLEIESLQTAIDITDEVFTLIIPELKIGAKEKDIAAKISYLFKTNGAEGDSYDAIIGSGWLGALPHAKPTDKKFAKGDFVVMDFGALYNGYHADMTRTIIIGEASEKHKEIYNLVLKSQLSGISIAKAGITGAAVDNACRQIINKAGYGDKFIHSTGHGIGLEVHTYPRISSYNKKPLLENYVITIEPGIYLEGWGGVRIEDDCLIKKNSCLPLNKSTKELLIL